MTEYSTEIQAERDRIGRPECQLVGEDGNAWAIMGRVGLALRHAGYSRAAVDAYHTDSTSGDYDHVLQVAMEWVEEPDEEEDEEEDSCPGCGLLVERCTCDEEEL